MDKYFGHRQYCTKVERTSRFGMRYEFRFPNGLCVSVSRDMKSWQEWFGQWEVRIIASDKIHISSTMGHKSPKEVEDALNMLMEQFAD